MESDGHYSRREWSETARTSAKQRHLAPGEFVHDGYWWECHCGPEQIECLYAAPPPRIEAAVGSAAPGTRAFSGDSGTLSPSPGARNKFASMPCWRVYRS